jgi:hypothetical protein
LSQNSMGDEKQIQAVAAGRNVKGPADAGPIRAAEDYQRTWSGKYSRMSAS